MGLFPEDDLVPPRRPERTTPSSATAATARNARPLAERLRPRRLEDFQGQEHLLGAGRPLGAVVEGRGPLHSLILWGPPGCGKTTLARLLAERAGLHWSPLSAVESGVRSLRDRMAEAEQRLRTGVGTALFVDEIHRFNKAQQDALLPYVERGSVTLIGATTENPSFEVIPALRSRCAIYALRPLDEVAMRALLERAVSDPEHGWRPALRLEDEAREWIVRLAHGDARRALQLLERAAPGARESIDRDAIGRVLERRGPDYDKDGDAHYDVISAFIKSLRGSDADAALYWLARMLEGGEDPRFIARRMLIFASEDVGNADPQALPLALAAAQAFERLGMPEGRIPLAQAATYLASAEKSCASYRGLGLATAAVRESGALPVPLHLRNAPTALQRREGHGSGYVYPHDAPDAFVPERYLPDPIAHARFYEPRDHGAEREIAARSARRWGQPKRVPEPPSPGRATPGSDPPTR